MPYPKRLLNEGEEVALDLKPHWWYFSKHILTGVPLFVLLVVLLGALHGDPERYSAYVWIAVALVWAGWLALKYFEWTATHFVVTSDRVIFRTGVLSKRGVEIPLERINNINFDQSIWERIIGAGDLEIESAGREGQSVFDDVNHPDGVQQEVYRQMEANAKKRAGWASAGATTSASAPSIPEQISQLAALRDAGHITDEEYEAKKADLLERM